MKFKFQIDSTLNDDEIEVVIKALRETESVDKLISIYKNLARIDAR